MPDELDPTTARLVSELAASMLPVLTKSLTAAIPSTDFAGAAERMNRTAQDMRSEIVKSVRAAIDDSRAGRSMIIQSVGTVLEEVANLRRTVDRFPEMLQSAIKSAANAETPAPVNAALPEEVMTELEGISERIDTLTQGIKTFFEAYAEHRENDAPMPEILRPSFDPDMLSGLEGLIRAEGKTHSTELSEFTRDIAAMTEENNAAMIHEVREAVAEEFSGIAGGDTGGHHAGGDMSMRMMKLIAGLSGAGVVLLVVNLIVMLAR